MSSTPVPIEELLPHVMLYCKACPEIVAIAKLRESARALCQRAPLWRVRDTFTISTPDGQGMCTVQDASIVRIDDARLGEYVLTPVTVGWLDMNEPGWDETTADEDETASSARFIAQLTANTVKIVPKVDGEIKVRFVLRPSRDAETFPEFLVEQHAELIGKGASGQLMLIPGTEYANPQLGAVHMAEFKAGCDMLAVTAVKGQQNAPLRTKAQFF